MSDNPRQRDTEKHATMALRKHLGLSHPTHRHVSAAEFPNGDMVKLDGHTRAYLWGIGKLAQPEDGMVSVTVFKVMDKEEAKDLYDAYDNPIASMTIQDRIHGSKHEHGLEFHSACLNNLHATSLKMVDAIVMRGELEGEKPDPVHEIIGRWKPILEMVDTRGYIRVDTGTLAGILMSWVLHAGTGRKLDLENFWESYFSGAKSGDSGRWLPSEALSIRVKEEKAKGSGRGPIKRILAYIFLSLDSHFSGKTYLGKRDPNLRIPDSMAPQEIVMQHIQKYGGILPVNQWEKISALR